MKKVENVQDAWARWRLDRLEARVGSVVGGFSGSTVFGYHDEFTAAATPATSYTLTYTPILGTCQMSLNGLVLIEGAEYRCDYSTGVVTVSASLTSGDALTFRYLVAGAAPTAARIAQTAIGHVNSGGSGIVTATFAGMPTPGNVVMMVLSKYAPRGDTVSPPGTQQALSPAGSGNISIDVYWRIVASGDGAAFTATEGFGFTDAMTLGVYEIADSDANPGAWSYLTQAASASPLSQSVTDTAGQLLLVGCAFHAGSSSGPLTTITPSGYTEDRHIIGDFDSLIIGRETATGSAQSIGTSWDGADGDALQLVIAVPGA